MSFVAASKIIVVMFKLSANKHYQNVVGIASLSESNSVVARRMEMYRPSMRNIDIHYKLHVLETEPCCAKFNMFASSMKDKI